MSTPRSPQASASALVALESSVAAAGAPYTPINHALGSPPTPIPDIPVSAVFLVIFLVCAVLNIRLLRGNLKKGHKFIFSGAMFGFSNIRVISAVLRIAWAKYPHNVRLGIAANIFIFAGVFILYVINIFFTQRIIRAQHPHFGWTKPFDILIPVAVVIAMSSLVLVIVATIQSFYTLDLRLRRMDHDMTLFVSTAFAVLAFLPTPMLLISRLLPRRTPKVDNFGTGRLGTKYLLVIFTSIVLTLGISFRDAVQFLPPVNILSPSPWYFSKACFYVFGFVADAIVIIAYLIFRVDLRFYIPNGAKGPGSYSLNAGPPERLYESSLPAQDFDEKDVESQMPHDQGRGDVDIDDKSDSEVPCENKETRRGLLGEDGCDCLLCNPQWNQEELLLAMFGKDEGRTDITLAANTMEGRGGIPWQASNR